MNHSGFASRCGFAIGLLLACGTGFADESVLKELKELRAEVEQLRAKQGESWLNEQRTQEVKSLVKDVLADADTRASLAESGATAGYKDGNAYIASEDGKSLLNVSGFFQLRYVANWREERPGVNHFESGFEMRRAKVDFQGFIGDPRIEYRVLLAANRDTGAVELEYAMIRYAVNNQLHLFGGQFQDTLGREQMGAARYILGVERTPVATIFTGNDDFTQGVGAQWDATDRLRISTTVNDGLVSGKAGTNGTGFQNTGNDFHNDSTDVAWTGRADLRVTGPWSEMAEFTSWSNTPLSAFVGAAVHYELGKTGDDQASATTAATGPYDDFVLWTADGLLKSGGLTLAAAFYGWHFDAAKNNPNLKGDTNNYAVTVEVAYQVIPDKLQPYVEYSWISIDKKLADANTISFINAGFNYYVRRHAVKFTADVMWVPDNLNSINTMGISLTGVGLLPDGSGAQNQVVGRAQIQVFF